MKEFIEKLIGRLEERIFSAELYNDVCEWKIYGNGKHAVTSHGQVKYKYEVEDWCICPYCGKKIKVVE